MNAKSIKSAKSDKVAPAVLAEFNAAFQALIRIGKAKDQIDRKEADAEPRAILASARAGKVWPVGKTTGNARFFISAGNSGGRLAQQVGTKVATEIVQGALDAYAKAPKGKGSKRDFLLVRVRAASAAARKDTGDVGDKRASARAAAFPIAALAARAKPDEKAVATLTHLDGGEAANARAMDEGVAKRHAAEAARSPINECGTTQQAVALLEVVALFLKNRDVKLDRALDRALGYARKLS